MLKRLIISGLVLSWSLTIGPWSFADTPLVTRIEMKRNLGLDYLDIYTTGFVKTHGLLLENQLIITFPQASFSKRLKIKKRSSPRIKDIYTRETTGEGAQLVVELKKPIEYEIVNVFGNNKSVVEIGDRQDYTERLMAAWEKINLKAKGDPIQAFKYHPVTGEALPLRHKVIVIEPGHGGMDPGAFTKGGIPEKYLTLQTARVLAHRLSQRGATVYLTRNTDRTCNLRDVVDFTNKIRADIFLSIHYNFMSSDKVCGTETYYYNLPSRNLALSVHQSLLAGIKRKDRGLRREMYYTVHHAQMPAVLVEPLYISNPEEAGLAASESFEDQIAVSISEGVTTYVRSKVH